MSSGYLLLSKNNITKEYITIKVTRIVKVVFFWSIVVSLLLIILKTCEKEVNDQFIFLKTFFGSFIQKSNLWHFWYFGSLILIYLFMPVLCKYKDNHLKWLLVLIIAGFLLQLTSYIAAEPIQKNIIQTFRMWTWLKYFILGGLLEKHNFSNIRGLKKRLFILFVLLLFPIPQMLLSDRCILNSSAEYFYDSLFYLIWMLLIFKLVMTISINNKLSSIIKKVSSLTMGMYIVHPIVIRIIDDYFPTISNIDAVYFFFIILVTTFIFAYLVFKLPVIGRFSKL